MQPYAHSIALYADKTQATVCLLTPGRAKLPTSRVALQLGHQAANCTNGTINWKQIYGEEAFRLKAPLYESDFERLRKVKQVDFDDLAKRATEYAKVSFCAVSEQCRALRTHGLAFMSTGLASDAADVS